MSSFNEENLRRYMPHLFSNSHHFPTKSTPSDLVSHTKSIPISNPKIDIDYIVSECPKTSIVRQYFSDLIQSIDQLRSSEDRESINTLDSINSC